MFGNPQNDRVYNYLRQEEPEWVCGPLRRHPSHLPGDGAAGAAKGWDAKKGGLKLECDNYPAFAQCRESIAPIPAGGSLARTDTLPLKPGVNKLTLALDQLNQVKETNENDNIYQVTITVNGTCGLSPRAIQPQLNLPRK